MQTHTCSYCKKTSECVFCSLSHSLVHSLCLCLVVKKDEFHFESLSSCLPSVHLIFQLVLSVCLSASIILCSPFVLAENISMWSWTHLSQPDGCLSNCHSPLPHLLHSRLNTKKRTTDISMAQNSRRSTHTQYHVCTAIHLSFSYYHSMHLHISTNTFPMHQHLL